MIAGASLCVVSVSAREDFLASYSLKVRVRLRLQVRVRVQVRVKVQLAHLLDKLEIHF